jgi:hypothetical protein
MINSEKKYKIVKKIYQLAGELPQIKIRPEQPGKTQQSAKPQQPIMPQSSIQHITRLGLTSKVQVIEVLTFDICDILQIIFENEELFNNVKSSLIKLFDIPFPARTIIESISWKDVQGNLKNKETLKGKIRSVLTKIDPMKDEKGITESIIDLISYILGAGFSGFIVKKSLSFSGVCY